MRHFLLLFLSIALLLNCESESTEMALPLPSRVSWEVISNTAKAKASCLAAFTFYNDSESTISGENWDMFYNQTNRKILDNLSEAASVEQIIGDFYRLQPNENFVIPAKDSLVVRYECAAWLIKESDAPHGLYWNIQLENGAEKQQYVQNYSIKPFSTEAQVSRHRNDKIPMVTATSQYEDNEYLSVLPKDQLTPIIPRPKQMEKGQGEVMLGGDWTIYVPSESIQKEAEHLQSKLQELTGMKLEITKEEAAENSIQLILNQGNASQESYELRVAENVGVQILAFHPKGIFYGIQSLLSLISADAILNKKDNITLAIMTVRDAPRFPYRGMHLDVGRNFHDLQAVKKMIDVMAFYKLNKLHLHLTEDEGWRLEIEDLPELTEVGARRGHTLESTDYLHPSYGSGFDPNDQNSSGIGYYNKADFIEILKYADDRHIEVIPEINVPGHARAAIKAMEKRYRKYMAQGEEAAAVQYLLSDMEDQSEYQSVQDFPDNVVCVCRESLYQFYEKVVDEILEMYEAANVPLKTLHTGGDEVPNGVWTKSPVCDKLMQEKTALKTPVDLSTYFMQRINRILTDRNIATAGWEEVAMKKIQPTDSTYAYIPHPDFTASNVIPYVWQNLSGNQDLGYRLANAGYPVVLCNVTNFYFDLAYNKDPKEPGFYWGGFIDSRKPFEMMPYEIFKSTTEDPLGNEFDLIKNYANMEQLKPEARSNILGIQGELWTETVKKSEMLEYYYLPKLIGLAERAWSDAPEWESIDNQESRENVLNQDWNIMANTIAQEELPRWSYVSGGYNYRIPTPGAILKEGMLYANVSLPGLVIRYTTDGSAPNENSALYQQPVPVSGVIQLKAFDAAGKESRTVEVESLR
ncbi:MAG: family 20 glycosylhydrolase [Bacteroidota bacterium]